MILDFGSFTRRGLLADLEHPVEIWGGVGVYLNLKLSLNHYLKQSGVGRPERRW